MNTFKKTHWVHCGYIGGYIVKEGLMSGSGLLQNKGSAAEESIWRQTGLHNIWLNAATNTHNQRKVEAKEGHFCLP